MEYVLVYTIIAVGYICCSLLDEAGKAAVNVRCKLDEKDVINSTIWGIFWPVWAPVVFLAVPFFLIYLFYKKVKEAFQ